MNSRDQKPIPPVVRLFDMLEDLDEAIAERTLRDRLLDREAGEADEIVDAARMLRIVANELLVELEDGSGASQMLRRPDPPTIEHVLGLLDERGIIALPADRSPRQVALEGIELPLPGAPPIVCPGCESRNRFAHSYVPDVCSKARRDG